MPRSLDPAESLTLFLGTFVREEVEFALEAALPERLHGVRYGAHLTREEAAEYLGISLRRQGKLPYEKAGGRVVIPTEACEAYLRRGYAPTRGAAQREVQQ